MAHIIITEVTFRIFVFKQYTMESVTILNYSEDVFVKDPNQKNFDIVLGETRQQPEGKRSI